MRCERWSSSLLGRSVALGTTMPLRALADLAREGRSGAEWLRTEYAATRSMPDVVRHQALLWRGEAAARR